MPLFRYRAARPDGSIFEDSTEDDNERAVRARLEGQGILILELNGKGVQTASYTFQRKRKPLSLREFLVFNQEFLALIKSGLPMLRSFDLLSERASKEAFQHALLGLREEIRGGSSISDAMANYPTYFSELYQASIRSGEQSGNLPEVIQRYIEYLKLLISVREKVVKALAYPSFLVVFGFAIVGFLLAYVMPIFAEVYAESNTELPLATQLLLDTITYAGVWLPWVLVGVLVTGIGFHLWWKTPQGLLHTHRWLLRIPMIGDVVLKNQVIRFTRTLSTILAGGIPLLSALQVTARGMTNQVFTHALAATIDSVKDGKSLSSSLKHESFLPRMTIEMIEVGETTGSLETMLLEVAEFHEGELDLQLSRLTTWIEPLLLLGMGILVGGIVIIMYLPIFNLAGAI
ncbi:MAG: type II secretion system protein [Nitrospirales bacterium]|nr:MAG: type II secretion system protein [Nitrospirales bacterium]